MNTNTRTYKGLTTFDNTTKMGGYELFILKSIADYYGDGTFRVFTLPLAKDQEELDYVEYVANHVQYAYRDDEKYVFVLVGGCTGWLSAFEEYGFTVSAKSKVVKRLKSFNRPALLNGEFEHLGIKEVAPLRFMNRVEKGYASNYDEDWQRRILDGGLGMRRSIFEIMRHNSTMHTDPFKAKMQDERLDNTFVVNIRIWTPMGFLKGNCGIIDDDVFTKMYGADNHVVVMDNEFKTAITTGEKYFILAEPQLPSDEVVTDPQTMINLPKLFRLEDMDQWIKDHFKHAMDVVDSGKLLFNVANTLRHSAQLAMEGDNSESVETHFKWAAAEAVASGLDIRTMPDMLTSTARTFSARLYRPEQTKLRVPIPCSLYRQVVSQSFAHMCGHNIKVQEGTIRSCSGLGVHVVNDFDWIEMYVNHGGHDLDDFFHLFFRNIGGTNKVILVRSPNGYGEYTILDHVDGDSSPKWHKADGTIIQFPEVNDKGWPKRLGYMLDSGDVTYTGLPSQNSEEADPRHHDGPYSVADFMLDVQDSMENVGSAGFAVNAVMLWTMVFGMHRPVQLCSLEDMIDSYTQGGSVDDHKAIDEYARMLVLEVVESGKPVDKMFYTSRNYHSFLPDGTPLPTFTDSRFTKGIMKVRTAIHNFSDGWHMVRHNGRTCEICVANGMALTDEYLGGTLYQYAQAHASLPDEVMALGRRFLGEWGGTRGQYAPSTGASNVVRNFRLNIFRMNSQNRTDAINEVQILRQLGMDWEANAVNINPRISKEQWSMLHQGIIKVIRSFDNKNDRHDYVLALAVAAYSNRTTGVNGRGRRISENIVTNQEIWPYYVEALRHYGQASDIFGNKQDEWELECVNCHKQHHTDSPMTLQRYQALGFLCSDCRELDEWTVQCSYCSDQVTFIKEKLGIKQLARFVSFDKTCIKCRSVMAVWAGLFGTAMPR